MNNYLLEYLIKQCRLYIYDADAEKFLKIGSDFFKGLLSWAMNFSTSPYIKYPISLNIIISFVKYMSKNGSGLKHSS